MADTQAPDPKRPVRAQRLTLSLPGLWAHVAPSLARYDSESILGGYGVDTLFLQRGAQEPRTRAAPEEPDWVLGYDDSLAVVLRKVGP